MELFSSPRCKKCVVMLRGAHGNWNELDPVFPDTPTQEAVGTLYSLAAH